MTGILDEALGIKEPRKSFDELADEEYSQTAMVAIEPDEPPKESDPPNLSDKWKDYEYSRKVAHTNLKQAQIALQAAVEFTNSSPSARSFEVLGGLIKTVSECTDKLLDLQKKMRELEKEQQGQRGDKKDKEGGSQYFIIGDPTDVLDRIDSMRKEKDIEGTSERKD